MTTIKNIDRDLLKALLLGGKIVNALSRTNEKTEVSAHVVIVEMPKDVIFNCEYDDNKNYWKYLVFLNTPDISGWWHASSNNLTKRENAKMAWNEWSEFRHHVK